MAKIMERKSDLLHYPTQSPIFALHSVPPLPPSVRFAGTYIVHLIYSFISKDLFNFFKRTTPYHSDCQLCYSTTTLGNVTSKLMADFL